MMTPCSKKWMLTVNGDTEADASQDHCTDDDFGVSRNYGYGLVFIMDGLDADPIVTIEGSNDGVKFVNVYSIVNNAETGDVTPIKILLTGAFSDTAEGVCSVNDTFFPYRFIRVCYEANGVTTGTIQYQLSLLQQ